MPTPFESVEKALPPEAMASAMNLGAHMRIGSLFEKAWFGWPNDGTAPMPNRSDIDIQSALDTAPNPYG